MHPTTAIELAASHQADLLRTAEAHRRARLSRPAPPRRRRAQPLVATVRTSQLLQGWRGRLLGRRPSRESGATVCCA